MSVNTSIPRRQALRRLGGAVGSLLAAPAAVAHGGDRAALVRRLSGVFSQPAEAAALGRLYMAARGSTPDGEELAAEVCSDLGIAPAQALAADLAVLRRLADQRVRLDFKEGRVVELGGWMLSRTEINLCAITALS